MADALKVIPNTDTVKTGVRNVKSVSQGLADVLSDTYRLTFKTHAYHWTVEGPLFFSIHTLTKQQYEDMFAATDILAEHIRAFGQFPPMRMSDILDQSIIEDRDTISTAGQMCEDLATDHERVAHRLHALIKLAGDHHDPVTEDLATARSAFHEQAAWMLRALAKN